MKEPLLNDDPLINYVNCLPQNMRGFIFDASNADAITKEALQRIINDFNLNGSATPSGVFLIENNSSTRDRLEDIFPEDLLISLQDNGVKIVL